MSDVDRCLYKALPHADEEANSVFSHAVPAKKAIVASFFLLRKLCVYQTWLVYKKTYIITD